MYVQQPNTMDNSYVTVDPYEEIVDHVSFGSHTAEVHTPQIAVRTPNAASFQESTPNYNFTFTLFATPPSPP